MQNKPVMVNLEQCGGYAALMCPVCGHDNVAPTVVTVVGGIGGVNGTGIGTRVDASGTAVYAAPTFERGVHIELTFSCECQHVFVYELQFYKGQTQVRLREYPFFESKSLIW